MTDNKFMKFAEWKEKFKVFNSSSRTFGVPFGSTPRIPVVLRFYKGSMTTLDFGLHGIWNVDPEDTSSEDNTETVIVDELERRWKKA